VNYNEKSIISDHSSFSIELLLVDKQSGVGGNISYNTDDFGG
jgi:hypothetical protein